MRKNNSKSNFTKNSRWRLKISKCSISLARLGECSKSKVTQLEWFKSYLSNRKQYVSINGYDSNLADVKFGVPQRSVLGPLLFLIYINDLNQALKLCKVHHFADDTNLIHFSKSVNRLNKYVNLDFKNLTY